MKMIGYYYLNKPLFRFIIGYGSDYILNIKNHLNEGNISNTELILTSILFLFFGKKKVPFWEINAQIFFY